MKDKELREKVKALSLEVTELQSTVAGLKREIEIIVREDPHRLSFTAFPGYWTQDDGMKRVSVKKVLALILERLKLQIVHEKRDEVILKEVP